MHETTQPIVVRLVVETAPTRQVFPPRPTTDAYTALMGMDTPALYLGNACGGSTRGEAFEARCAALRSSTPNPDGGR